MRSKDLSPGAREAIAAKAITGAWELRALLRLLEELERWDLGVEGRKQSAAGILTAGKIATTVSTILLALMLIVAQTLEFLPILLAVTAASVGVLLWGRRQVKAAVAMDLPDELRLTVRPFLRRLSGDIAPGGKIKVNFDLRAMDPNQPKESKAPGYARKGTPANLFLYEEPLGSFRLPLADGCAAILKMENVYHKVTKSKRSASGKYKSKVKWKKVSTVTAMLVPPAPFAWQESRIRPHLNSKQETMTFTEKDGVKIARIDRFFKYKSPSARPADLAPLDDIMSIFVRLAAMRPPAAQAQSGEASR